MNNLENEELNIEKNSIDVDYQNAPTIEEMQAMNNMNYQMGAGQGYMNSSMNNQMGMNYGQMGQQYDQFGNPINQNMNNNFQGQAMNHNQQYNQNQFGNNMNQQMNQGMYNQQYNGMQGQGMYSQGMYNGQMQQQYQNNQMGMNQGYANPMNQGGMNMNMGSQGGAMVTQNNEMGMQDLSSDISEYKQRLRGMRDVQALTSEIDVHNTNSIVNFGQKASDNISKISDELLNSMRAVKSEEASEMLVNLTKIMDKFDIKEIENAKPDSGIAKLFRRMGTKVAELFQKYDTMGMEVQKVYVTLKKYENDIKDSNAHLKKLYDGNLEYYRILEKYIVAGEMAIEEIDMYLNQIPMNTAMNEEEKHMMLQKLELSKDMLSQRVYDLQVAENVAIQAAPMIQTIQMSNFNLMRKINSSFIVTLPIFKQCLAQAVILKRQEIQAKSIKQLDDKTNELIMRNAANTARQSVEIAKMASGSSVAIETLQKSFETIMKGIEDTKAIQAENRQQRAENSNKLEHIKASMKRNIAEV